MRRHERVRLSQAFQDDHLDDAFAVPKRTTLARGAPPHPDDRRVGCIRGIRRWIRESESIQPRILTRVRRRAEPSDTSPWLKGLESPERSRDFPSDRPFGGPVPRPMHSPLLPIGRVPIAVQHVGNMDGPNPDPQPDAALLPEPEKQQGVISMILFVDDTIAGS